MAHSLRYLLEAVNDLINSFENQECSLTQAMKLDNIISIAEGFKKEFEFQNYLVQLVQVEKQKKHKEENQKKYLLAQMVKLHIIKLNDEMEDKYHKNNRLGAYFQKSPISSRKRSLSPSSEMGLGFKLDFEALAELAEF